MRPLFASLAAGVAIALTGATGAGAWSQLYAYNLDFYPGDSRVSAWNGLTQNYIRWDQRYGGGQNPNGYYAAGMASAYTLVDTLRKAGKNLTRKGVLNAATHLNEKNNPFVLPGIRIRTTPSFRFPISQVRLERWHNGQWVIFGPLLSAKP